MILGIGNDLVNMRRIEKVLGKFPERFPARSFTQSERDKAQSRACPATVYAKHFAAKEACAKALGTGFRDGIAMHEIGVENNELGAPILKLTGMAKKRLEHITPEGTTPVLHLSFTDEPPYAQAFVIIEARTA